MSKAMIWTGRVLSGLGGFFLLTGGINMMFVRSADMVENSAKFGYGPETLTPIGLAAFVAAVLYLVPRTAILGAILLTGYLGGAVSTHVRMKDGLWAIPVVFGVLLWLGLYLRDEKLRELTPLRK